MGIKSWFRRISFRQKLSAVLLLSVYLPLAFVAVLSVTYTRLRLARDTQALFTERIRQAVAEVDGKLSEMKTVFATVNIQSWLFDILRSEDVVTESFEYIDNYRDMSWFLFSLKDGLEIDSIGLYFRRPNAFVDGVQFHPLEALETALSPVVTQLGSRVAIWLGPTEGYDSVSFVGPMLHDGAEFVFEGRVWVRVNADYFRVALSEISSTTPFAAWIVDEEGVEIISHRSDELEPDLSPVREESDTDSFIRIVQSLPTNRWTLEALIPRSFILREALKESRALLVALVLVTLAVAPALMLVSRSLAGRLARIREAMEASDGSSAGLLARIGGSMPEGGDEIDAVVRSYNRMAHRIETLVDTVYRAELESTRHHLSALHSQINPHFLYNALDAIRCNVSLNERELAEDIIRSLSRLLRIALSGGRELISVARELELVSLYLKLNTAVYGERFGFHVEQPTWSEEYAIPKFVLQPLVENAITHGLQHLDSGGEIKVSAFRDNGRIAITVADNGVGMSERRRQEITADLSCGSDSGSGGSIGLPNVDQRIKLTFGADYGVAIANGESGGARVSLFIPAISIDEENE